MFGKQKRKSSLLALGFNSKHTHKYKCLNLQTFFFLVHFLHASIGQWRKLSAPKKTTRRTSNNTKRQLRLNCFGNFWIARSLVAHILPFILISWFHDFFLCRLQPDSIEWDFCGENRNHRTEQTHTERQREKGIDELNHWIFDVMCNHNNFFLFVGCCFGSNGRNEMILRA